ncbi:Zinc finger (CCCH type) protein, related [Neospora caninum Liverpool]|uniref:Zinc finger (CCCH type) protein, related n=1 Tax=Neospora caninum (strain Liverpool) TaxID=572307 RepID=F0VFB9_NEOCL|nr:Zinc finger (CCCH type) protein, related [Neospora caninum Liverpool]CBZ52413.1 Zinc finger (CCCH type) protein, related [Neospora caninum Liverpool]CEL66385.1 TPA: Zinc finger (CCCH type) protein, related [Neospora caninum Liverpool]|eukprot:XP_003882445.1 Zinc finger (CCCH type) protein, related [Neospora caninum Liverpool]
MCAVNEAVELVVGGQVFYASASTLRRSRTLRQLLQKVSPSQSPGSGDCGQPTPLVPESDGDETPSCCREGSTYPVANPNASAQPRPAASPSVTKSIFIDRDPYRFSFVLEYLRNGQLDVRETSGGQKVFREVLEIGAPAGDNEFSDSAQYHGCSAGESDDRPEGSGSKFAACLSLVSLRCEFDYFSIGWPSRCMRCDVLFDPSRCRQRPTDSKRVDLTGGFLGLQHDRAEDTTASAVGQTSTASSELPALSVEGEGDLELKCYYHPGELIAIDLSASDCDNGSRKRALERQRAGRRKHLYYTCCNRRDDAVGCEAGAHLSEEEALASVLRRQSPPLPDCGVEADPDRLPGTSPVHCSGESSADNPIGSETGKRGEGETSEQVVAQHYIAAAMSACETEVLRRMQEGNGACCRPARSADGCGSVRGGIPAPESHRDSILSCGSTEKREAASGAQETWACSAKSVPADSRESLPCAADSPNCSGHEFAVGPPFADSGLQMPQYPGMPVCSASSPGVGYPLAVHYSQQAPQGAAVWSGGSDTTSPSSVPTATQQAGFPGAYLPAYSVDITRPPGSAAGTDNSAASMALAFCQPAATARYPYGSSVPPVVPAPWICPFYFVPGTVPPGTPHGTAPNLLLAPQQSQSEPPQLLHPQLNAPQAPLYAWDTVPAPAAGAPATQPTKSHESLLACSPACAPELGKPGGEAVCPWQDSLPVALRQDAGMACCPWPHEQPSHHQRVFQEQFCLQHLHVQQYHGVHLPGTVANASTSPPLHADAAVRGEAVEQTGATRGPRLTERQSRSGYARDAIHREGETDDEGRSRETDPEAERAPAGRAGHNEPSGIASGEALGSEPLPGSASAAGDDVAVPQGVLGRAGSVHGASTPGSETRTDGNHSCVVLRRRRPGRAGGSRRQQPHVCAGEGKEESTVHGEQQPNASVPTREVELLAGPRAPSCCQSSAETSMHPCELPTARKTKQELLCREHKTHAANRLGRGRRSPDCPPWGSWQSADIEDAPSLECGAAAAAGDEEDTLAVDVCREQRGVCTCQAADATGDGNERICSTGGLETPVACGRTREKKGEHESCGYAGNGASAAAAHRAGDWPLMEEGQGTDHGIHQDSAGGVASKGTCSALASGSSGKAGCAMNPLFKTKMCPLLKAGLCPKTARRCKFAHALQELRPTAEFYKTQMCSFWMMGFCRAGISCRHAHGADELKVRPVGESRPPVETRPVGDTRPAASSESPKEVHDGSATQPGS